MNVTTALSWLEMNTENVYTMATGVGKSRFAKVRIQIYMCFLCRICGSRSVIKFFMIEIIIITCPDLYDPPYGSVNMTDNTPGSTAHYECDYGFKLVGDAYRECLYNGYWSGKAPVCKSM